MKTLNIANFGGYDVDNYGDLLFPYILEHRLRDKNINIIHVSPTGKNTEWEDSRASISCSEFFDIIDFIDGIIVGGGHVVHLRNANLKFYLYVLSI